MKGIVSMAMAATLLVSSGSFASPTESQTAEQDNSMSKQSVEHLFVEEEIQTMISVAYQTKSTRYANFATLFNLCQKQPEDARCGDEYTQKKSHYETANANHAVLTMVYGQEFKYLLMPEVNYPELVEALRNLGYLGNGIERDVNYSDTLAALNEWLMSHNMPKTDDIYFLHALLVRTEELSQLLRDEEVSDS